MLKDGAGKPIQNGIIQLTARRHSTTVLASTVASVRSDETGRYSMDVEYGQYSVTLLVDGYPPSNIGDITVYEDSQPGALNDFLLKFTEQNARPEVIIHLEELVSHARANAEAAAEYAESVKKIFDSIRTMDATTTQKGLVQLSSDTDSGSEDFAATSKAVKLVMDETQKKASLDSPEFTGTPMSPVPPPDASGNEIANAAFVRALIAEALASQGAPVIPPEIPSETPKPALQINRVLLQSGEQTRGPLTINRKFVQSGRNTHEPITINTMQLQTGLLMSEPVAVNRAFFVPAYQTNEPLTVDRAVLQFAVLSAA
ncbi:prophage tail fiber N-terminal domain-containing protein [Escherichia coli]|uniref:prophage tail fiber N-terminal domain-containing protein n=1 Tax=Escherichia coli TaxID=562 RepID=UPI0039A5F4E9